MAPVVDILEALKMSLAEVRKPPLRAVSAAGSGQAAEAQHGPRKRARKTSTG
jgi:hypothetical protein